MKKQKKPVPPAEAEPVIKKQPLLKRLLFGPERPDLSELEAGSTTILDILSPTAIDTKSRDYTVVDGVFHAYLYITGYGYSTTVGSCWLAPLVEAGEGVNVSFSFTRQNREKILSKIAQTTMLNRSRMRDVGDTRQDYEELDSAITSGLYLKDVMNRQGEDFYYMHTLIEVVADDPDIPYGYLRNAAAASYDIDEDTAPVVRRIFALRSEGVSFNAIAKQLNQEHIPSPAQLRYLRGMNSSAAYRDALWSRATIRKIVGSDVYIGNRTYGKVSRNHLNEKKKRQPTEQWTVIPNAHPPIISKELFDAVQQVNQEVLASRAAYRTCADVGDVQADLFRGKLFCAECGSPMGAGKGCARHGAHSPSRLFYDCNRYRYSAHTVCSSHYIRHERLLAAVTDALDQQLALAVDVERLIHEIDHSAELTQAKQEKQNTATSLRLQRQGLDRKLDMLIHDLSTGLIGREEFLYAKEKYQAELNRILAAEVAQKERIEQMQKGLSTAQAWVCAMQEYRRLPAITRELLDTLVERISIHEDRSITIQLNYADPFAALRPYHPLAKEAVCCG